MSLYSNVGLSSKGSDDMAPEMTKNCGFGDPTVVVCSSMTVSSIIVYFRGLHKVKSKS